jgi:hypothetical protein
MADFLTAVAMVTTPAALFIAWVYADRWLATRTEARRRAEQDRVDAAEMAAELAAIDATPVVEHLHFSRWEAEL